MEVSDISKDERFQDNSLVIGALYIRFYAGALIVIDAGYVLGMVCVIDDKLCELTQAQQETLAALAQHASARLRLGEKAQQLAEASEEAERSLALMRSTLDATA